jgi:hypothetical protein
MRKRLVLGWILAIGCGLAGAAPVAATPFAFDVLLTSDQVYPTDTGSSAAGSATLRYDPDTDLLSANVLVVGISRADLRVRSISTGARRTRTEASWSPSATSATGRMS